MSIDDGPATAPDRGRPTGWIVMTGGEGVDQLDAKRDEAVAGAETAEQARACLSGTLGALDADSSSGGVQAAVVELETLSGQCRSAASR